MSQAAALQGTFEHLQSGLGLNAGEIGMEPPGGAPPPVRADLYVAVTVRGVTNTGERNASFINEWHTVEVVVFKNSQVYPLDRQHTMYLEKIRGVEVLSDRVVALLHGREEHRTICNTKLEDEPEFKTPLFYLDRADIEYIAAADSNSADTATWMLQRCRFEGLRRYRKLAHLIG